MGFLFLSLYLLFHVSYRKILSHFGEFGGYAYHKQIELLNSVSDSIRERQEEKRKISPKETKRLRTRDEELENKIEKLSNTRSDNEDKPSFFEKIRTQGGLLKSSMPPVQTIIPIRNVPIITKNVSPDKHSDIKPFHGNWQYPRSDLLMYHPKGKPLTKQEIELQSAIIERTLLQF